MAIKDMGPCTAIALDISGFFDNLNHQRLKSEWTLLLGGTELPEDHYKVYRAMTRYAWVDRDKAFEKLGRGKHRRREHRERLCTPVEFRSLIRNGAGVNVHKDMFGIPQGSPMRAVLSNMYMRQFDDDMYSLMSSIGGRYYRYCDDILLLAGTNEAAEAEAQCMAKIEDVDLEIQPAKTNRVEFVSAPTGGLTTADDRRLQYLGFLFDGENSRIRSQTLSKYYRRMKRTVKHASKAAKRNGDDVVFRRATYRKYTHLGSANTVRYGLRAAELHGEATRRQVARHWRKVQDEFDRRADDP